MTSVTKSLLRAVRLAIPYFFLWLNALIMFGVLLEARHDHGITFVGDMALAALNLLNIAIFFRELLFARLTEEIILFARAAPPRVEITFTRVDESERAA